MNGIHSTMEVDGLLKQQQEQLQSKRAQRAKARMRHEAEKQRLKNQVDKKVAEAAARRRKGQLATLEGVVVLERDTDTPGNTSKPALDEVINLQMEYENMVELNDRYIEEKLRVSHQLYDIHDRLKCLLEENQQRKTANALLTRQSNQRHREMEAALENKRLELAMEQYERTLRDAAAAEAKAQARAEQAEPDKDETPVEDESPMYTLQELSDRIRTEERNIRTYQRKITNMKENLRKNNTEWQERESKYNALAIQRDEKEKRRQELEAKIISLETSLATYS